MSATPDESALDLERLISDLRRHWPIAAKEFERLREESQAKDARIAELEKDRARLEWLFSNSMLGIDTHEAESTHAETGWTYQYSIDWYDDEFVHRSVEDLDDFREAIDAAMAAQGVGDEH